MIHQNVLEDRAAIQDLIRGTHRIAVLGMKTERQANQPAFYVARYLAEAGFDVVPVPVYYPEATEILGRQVYRRLADIPGQIDLVDVFRRSHDIPPHVPDILEKRPTAVWLQLGIRNDAVAQELAEAGILVVQDHCLMVEHRRLGLAA